MNDDSGGENGIESKKSVMKAKIKRDGLSNRRVHKGLVRKQ